MNRLDSQSRSIRKTWKSFVSVLLPLAATATSYGFALLGPFEPWQTPQLGYNPFGQDIGAPKDIDEEFRWNVPVITYGVDRAFIEYFGTNGVRAVTEAFTILNNLPAASRLDPNGFLGDPRRINVRAEAANVVDVKSTVLALVLEQLGLASPERYTWALRDRQISSLGIPAQQATNYLVIQRNFDPLTFEPSSYVNGSVIHTTQSS